MRILTALVVFLAACGCGEDEDENVGYEIDRVPIVLVEGTGPEEGEMVLAVELYRREAETHFDMVLTEEQLKWRAIEEIAWTGDSVPDDGRYDAKAKKLLLRWRGCVVDSPLYWLLTQHYSDAAPTDLDRAWAEQLASDNSFLCE